MIDKWSFVITLIVFSSAFCCEHIARKNDCPIPPSFLINEIATYFQTGFGQIGYFLAESSRFIHVIHDYLNIEDIKITILALVHPIIRLVISPFCIITGYVETIKSYNQPYLILLGSIVLIPVVAFIISNYSKITLKNLFDKYKSVRGYNC